MRTNCRPHPPNFLFTRDPFPASAADYPGLARIAAPHFAMASHTGCTEKIAAEMKESTPAISAFSRTNCRAEACHAAGRAQCRLSGSHGLSTLSRCDSVAAWSGRSASDHCGLSRGALKKTFYLPLIRAVACVPDLRMTGHRCPLTGHGRLKEWFVFFAMLVLPAQAV